MPPDEKEALRLGAKTSITSLVKIAGNLKHKDCVRACEALLDRRYGRPVASLANADGSPLLGPPGPAVDSPLAALLARVQARKGAAAPAEGHGAAAPANAPPGANGEATRGDPS